MTIVSPSLLAADFLHLDNEIEMINRSEAEWLHLDVMDGVFVPNISFGFPVLEAVAKKMHQGSRCALHDCSSRTVYQANSQIGSHDDECSL